MFTQSLASSFAFPQPIVRGSESDHHSREKGIEAENPNNFQKRLADDSYQATPATHQSDTNNSGMVSSKMAVLGYATSITQSVDIQVTTQEGDEVTISLSQSASNSVSAFQAEQGSSRITASAESHTLKSDFNISIEGDLNKKELKSINKLIEKMGKVSDKFFNGNIKAAFKHAQKVGFDTKQIAGFSLDLKMDKSVQAVAAYQQTTIPEQNINTDLLKQAGDFLGETKAFMADTGAMLDSFVEPKQAFTDLFSGVAQLDGGADKEIDDNSGDQALFSKMIEHIANALFSNEVDGHDHHDDVDKHHEIDEHDGADEHDDD